MCKISVENDNRFSARPTIMPPIFHGCCKNHTKWNLIYTYISVYIKRYLFIWNIYINIFVVLILIFNSQGWAKRSPYVHRQNFLDIGTLTGSNRPTSTGHRRDDRGIASGSPSPVRAPIAPAIAAVVGRASHHACAMGIPVKVRGRLAGLTLDRLFLHVALGEAPAGEGN